MNKILQTVTSEVSRVFLTPQPHCLAGSVRYKSIRDEHRSGLPKTGDPLMDGTVGTESYAAVNVKGYERRLPTSETLKQKFFGVPFTELPMVYIKSTRNNTLIQVTDHKYNVITYTSCRLEGFKNARKKTTIAGQTTGVAAGQRLLRRGINAVRVLVKGIGPGRMSSVKGIASTGVNVVSITDRTLLPEIGPRPKKIRRV
ncbi:unnamed protein product [Bursaphelenchus xylophilus]|uniref:(pine wood nematode) hypothetical protein n=1 Tax=Bursaphelenchus xylophilus TaxID=6326 RepID=A0A1I7RNX3_BURXY|nr:unnamed protein product [Bursaphelenchus xylophilus]CAG9124360.1 unnamed protein product [Bursaphelenchus xylophilus]